jgi:hypothetical protein
MIRLIPWLPFCLIISLGLLNACGQKNEKGDSFIAGHWGHLVDVASSWAKPTFLINQPKNQVYNVCLDNQMAQDYPGIQAEIEAAINIWGHYLGRKVPVKFNLVALDASYDNETVSEYTNRIWRFCPRGTNIVVGIAHQDGSVGVTSYNSQGQRGLYLKVPEEIETYTDDDGKKVTTGLVWQTFRDVTSETKTGDELLNILISRNRSVFVSKEKGLFTLGVLMHEFGHVWGLCDQYVLSGDRSTNCDPKFASINGQGHIVLNSDAQMSKANRYSQLFLSDDDIQGIRTFLDRPSFIPAGQPTKDEALKTTVAPISLSAIEFVKIENVRRMAGKIEATVILRTSVPVNYFFSLSGDNTGSIDFDERIASSALSWTPMVYTMGINGPSADLDKLTLTIKVPKAGTEGEFENTTISAPIPKETERNVIVIR